MKTFVLALAGAIVFAGCVSEKKGEDSLPVGARMPEFSVSGPEGNVSSAELAGVRSVIVFFRTTCPDCSREMPNVEAAYKRVSGQGIRFVTISKEDNATEAVPKYWEETGMTMPYYLDHSGAAFTAFDVRYVPTLYLFGSDGKVARAEVETFQFTVDELVKMIEELK